MTLCTQTNGAHCVCQPDALMFCPQDPEQRELRKLARECGAEEYLYGRTPPGLVVEFTPPQLNTFVTRIQAHASRIRLLDAAESGDVAPPNLAYLRACERQNLDLVEAAGYPHEKDTLISPEEYIAELKRKADAYDVQCAERKAAEARQKLWLIVQLLASILTLSGIYFGSTTLVGASFYLVSQVFWYWATIGQRLWGLMPMNLATTGLSFYNLWHALA